MKKILGIVKAHSPEKSDFIKKVTGIIAKSFEVKHEFKKLRIFEDEENKDLYNELNEYEKIVMFAYKGLDKLKNYQINNSQKFIFLEMPIYKRKITSMSHEQMFLKISTETHLGNSFIKKYSDGYIRNGFKFEVKKSKSKKEYILIINQMLGDSAIHPINPYEWLESTVKKIREKTDIQILIREHPFQSKNIPKLHFYFKKKYNDVKVSKKLDITKDLEKAYCSVMVSSGSCIDSLFAGIPVITEDPRSHVYEITYNDVNKIKNFDNLTLPNLNELCSAISNTHYTNKEFLSGHFMTNFKRFLL